MYSVKHSMFFNIINKLLNFSFMILRLFAVIVSLQRILQTHTIAVFNITILT